MHGFYGSYNSPNLPLTTPQSASPLLQREAKAGKVQLIQATLNKFVDDKPFIVNENCLYAVEGVLLHTSTTPDCYDEYVNDKLFWNKWRGSFAGVYYDINTDNLFVFNDHVGDKMLFYTTINNQLFFSSDLYWLAQTIKSFAHLEYDKIFMWQMLTFGYSFDGRTPYAQIHRIGAGEYIHVENGQVEKQVYHRFGTEKKQLSDDEAILQINALFNQAVERVLNKNMQYGLRNVMQLSAGLDSRASVAVAKQMTNQPIDVITYSQTNYYDETIPKQIAKEWNLNMYFSALDGGDYLLDITGVNSITGGLINYAGAAQVKYGFAQYDKSQAGVILTGMLGDIVVNTFFKHDYQPYYGFGAISNRFLSNLKEYNVEPEYTHVEQYYLYVRGFYCANLGSPLIMQSFTESYSPFYDVDLLEFCSSIPLEQKYGYNLYDKWLLHDYPESTKWLHNGNRKIGSKQCSVNIMGRNMLLRDVPKRVVWYLCKKLGIYDFYKLKDGESMNPLDQWYATNNELHNYLDDFVANNIHLLSFDSELEQSSCILYERGSMMEKLQVITLIAILTQMV